MTPQVPLEVSFDEFTAAVGQVPKFARGAGGHVPPDTLLLPHPHGILIETPLAKTMVSADGQWLTAVSVHARNLARLCRDLGRASIRKKTIFVAVEADSLSLQLGNTIFKLPVVLKDDGALPEGATWETAQPKANISDQSPATAKLFAPNGDLSSGPSFDEETWAAAKPLFITALQKYKETASDIRTMIGLLIKELRSRGADRETIANMKPYVVRFVENVESGKISLAEAAQKDLNTSFVHKETGTLIEREAKEQISDPPGHRTEMREVQSVANAGDVKLAWKVKADSSSLVALAMARTMQMAAKQEKDPALMREGRELEAKAQAAIKAGKRTMPDALRKADEAPKGCSALFGNPHELGSGLSFDEDTYRKAVPFFKAGVAHFQQPGRDVVQMMDALRDLLLAKMSAAQVKSMKPYIVRFIDDVQDGKLSLKAEDGNVSVASGNLEQDTGDATAGDGMGGADVSAPGCRPRSGAGQRGGASGGRCGGGRVSNAGAPVVGEDGHLQLPERELGPDKGALTRPVRERGDSNSSQGLQPDERADETSEEDAFAAAGIDEHRRLKREAEEAKEQIADRMTSLLADLDPQEQKAAMREVQAMAYAADVTVVDADRDDPETFARQLLLENPNFQWMPMLDLAGTWEQAVRMADAAISPADLLSTMLPRDGHLE